MIYAYPTEGVWGLGCLPDSEKDVKKICSLKQRTLDKGLILVSGNFSHFEIYLSDLSQDLIDKAKSKWPGPHTWLVPANNNVPFWIKGNSTYVALRQSIHPSIIELSEKLNSVITSTSANISSEPAAKNAEEVKNLFGDQVSILRGNLGGANKPTPIQNLITDEWVRN
jgi:L-threonylcarbamoyladenylate synthase